MAGEDEFEVKYSVTNTEEYPAKFTDCHSHGSEMFCVDEDGEDVEVMAEGSHSDEEEGHDHEEEGHDDEDGGDEHSGQNCHFHAGVE